MHPAYTAATAMINVSAKPAGGSRHTGAARTKAWVATEAARFDALCNGKIDPGYIRAALLSKHAQVLWVTNAAAAIVLPGRTATELYIELICARRGGGHGRRLFEAIKRRAVALHKTSITLRAATRSLIEVYTRWGFARTDAPCGTQHPWWRSSALDTRAGYFMTMCLQSDRRATATVAQQFWDLAAAARPI